MNKNVTVYFCFIKCFSALWSLISFIFYDMINSKVKLNLSNFSFSFQFEWNALWSSNGFIQFNARTSASCWNVSKLVFSILQERFPDWVATAVWTFTDNTICILIIQVAKCLSTVCKLSSIGCTAVKISRGRHNSTMLSSELGQQKNQELMRWHQFTRSSVSAQQITALRKRNEIRVSKPTLWITATEIEYLC